MANRLLTPMFLWLVMFDSVGIIGYGTYVPRRRIKIGEIARVWGKDGEALSRSLNVKEKAVAAYDEDSCTLAVEAARIACRNIDSSSIGAVFVGSESPPYAVKPSSTVVAEALGATPRLTAADVEFACKAGTVGVQSALAMVASKMIDCGLSIGADTAQGRPNDVLEFSAGSGAGAILVGRENVLATIDATHSFSTDTPDFWRRSHAEFPKHAGRFTGEPAYFKHVFGAANLLFEETGTGPEDFDYAVFHQPNGRFPLKAAKKLGFDKEKVLPGLVTPFIGNTYSGATMIGLSAVLDVAKPGDRILAVSYGSGAGSDAFSLTATDAISKGRQPVPVFEQIKEKEYVDYALYVKHRRKLKSL